MTTPPVGPPRALVVFDLDGTLLRTGVTSLPTVADTCREFGVPVPPEEVTMSFPGRPASAWYDWLRAMAPPGREDAFVAAADRRELAHVAGPEAPYPGVFQVMRRLHVDGYRLEMCTNATPTYASSFLEGHSLTPWFAGVRCAGQGYASKPAMVAEALREANVPAAHVAVVGDRADDLAAARENGARCVGARYGFGAPEELAGADVLIDDLRDLPGVLAAWWS
jgi:phosphoglycolate phosphatase